MFQGADFHLDAADPELPLVWFPSTGPPLNSSSPFEDVYLDLSACTLISGHVARILKKGEKGRKFKGITNERNQGKN